MISFFERKFYFNISVPFFSPLLIFNVCVYVFFSELAKKVWTVLDQKGSEMLEDPNVKCKSVVGKFIFCFLLCLIQQP